MINSRSLDDLLPAVRDLAAAHLSLARAEGIDLLVTSTFRDFESQASLFAQGRSRPGRIVTNAQPGESYHNWRVAYDVVPLRMGKPVWGTTGDDLDLWNRVGHLGELAGLEWAGRWETFREFPHFQFTGGLRLRDLAAGRIPEHNA